MTLLNAPVHPGKVLKELFLKPLEMSPADLAERLLVQSDLVEKLCNEQIPMTAEMALRLSTFFGNSVEFWINIQTTYDLVKAREEVDLTGIIPLQADAA